MTTPPTGRRSPRDDDATVHGTDGPFDITDVTRAEDGTARFTHLAPTIVHALRSVVGDHPDDEAIVEAGGDRLTYGALWDRATKVAGGLRDAGAGPGTRVAVQLPNGCDWVVAAIGTLLSGATLVPINTRLSPAEIAVILRDSDPICTVTSSSGLPAGAPHIHDSGRAGDLAALFYTSGTTGAPKGATSSHEAVLASAEVFLRTTGIGRSPGPLRMLVCIPLFHVTGFNAQLVPTLLRGGTVVIQRELDVQEILAVAERERVSALVAVPAIWFYMLEHRDFRPAALTALRWALYGGAPIAPELVMRLKTVLPGARVGNGFGMSETSATVTMLPHEDADQYASSVGFPAPVIDVRIASPGDDGVGEILLRGQTITRGYWQDPARTAESITNGWLRTGDLGRLDDDGRLYLVDRLKDMINRGGENIFSVEVENVLAEAPTVAEVAVLGVPDAMMGEKVGCIVVPTSGTTLDVPAMLTYAAGRLADYKVPQYVVVREAPLPRNPGGKLLKRVLRDETTWGEPTR